MEVVSYDPSRSCAEYRILPARKSSHFFDLSTCLQKHICLSCPSHAIQVNPQLRWISTVQVISIMIYNQVVNFTLLEV
jgi:hypothetical protein